MVDFRRISDGETLTLPGGYEVDAGASHGGGRDYRVYTPPGVVFADHGTHVISVFGAREVRAALVAPTKRCEDPDCSAGCGS